MEGKIEISLFILIVILLIAFTIGIFVTSMYHEKYLDGCWARTSKGDWICVNIKDMTPQRALEVCKHEVGHEIFAETCEEDIDLCFELIEVLNGT